MDSAVEDETNSGCGFSKDFKTLGRSNTSFVCKQCSKPKHERWSTCATCFMPYGVETEVGVIILSCVFPKLLWLFEKFVFDVELLPEPIIEKGLKERGVSSKSK